MYLSSTLAGDRKSTSKQPKSEEPGSPAVSISNDDAGASTSRSSKRHKTDDGAEGGEPGDDHSALSGLYFVCPCHHRQKSMDRRLTVS